MNILLVGAGSEGCNTHIPTSVEIPTIITVGVLRTDFVIRRKCGISIKHGRVLDVNAVLEVGRDVKAMCHITATEGHRWLKNM